MQQLLQLLSPSHDPFVIKETLALIGRITQMNVGIQQELQNLGAIQTYSNLLFAQVGAPSVPALTPAAPRLAPHRTAPHRTARAATPCRAHPAHASAPPPVELLVSFPQMHDSAITELAALALVNLVSEVPSCMATVEQHPRFSAIRFELLASMARALSSCARAPHPRPTVR